MKLKHASEVPLAVLPRENEEGIGFLASLGYQQHSKRARMLLGQEIKWHYRKIYSRIRGNLG